VRAPVCWACLGTSSPRHRPAGPPSPEDRRAGLPSLASCPRPVASKARLITASRAEMAGGRELRARESWLRPGPVPGPLYTVILRHLVLWCHPPSLRGHRPPSCGNASTSRSAARWPDDKPPADPGLVRCPSRGPSACSPPPSAPATAATPPGGSSTDPPPGTISWFHVRARLEHNYALVS